MSVKQGIGPTQLSSLCRNFTPLRQVALRGHAGVGRNDGTRFVVVSPSWRSNSSPQPNEVLPNSRLVSSQQRVGYSSRRNQTKTRSGKQSSPKPITISVEARPPGTADIETKFPLPDRDAERALREMQSRIQDLFQNGQYSEALEPSQELLLQTSQHFGKDHPATAAAFNNLGLIEKLLGHYDKSRKYYTEALKVYKVALGADHQSYASALHNIGSLNRNQIHLDETLKDTERLTLLEEALEQLEQAYQIREAELGPEHPHTVASRSGWGSAIATQILHYHKAMEDPEKRRRYISLRPKAITNQGWDAAEDHLRQALRTAVENPRGRRLPPPTSSSGGKTKRKDIANHSSPNDSPPRHIETLSAASAAQNLAVFLKAKATTMEGGAQANKHFIEEARQYYDEVLKVRSELLPPLHPDLLASKHSMAELLETLGEEEAANLIRQEILDTYDPPETQAKSDTTE